MQSQIRNIEIRPVGKNCFSGRTRSPSGPSTEIGALLPENREYMGETHPNLSECFIHTVLPFSANH